MCGREPLLVGQGFLRSDAILNLHVVKFFGIKDFTAFQALYKFSIFMPGDDSYPGVFAGAHNGFANGWIELLFPPIVASFAGFSSDKLSGVPGGGLGGADVVGRGMVRCLKHGQIRSYTK